MMDLLPEVEMGQSFPYWAFQMSFFTRHPQPLPSWNTFINIFNFPVWIGLIIAQGSFAISFACIYYFYKTVLKQKLLLKKQYVHPSDFVLLCYFALTEPDPMPWFSRKISAGRIHSQS